VDTFSFLMHVDSLQLS